MRIETKLNIETYLATAERIANGYFAEDGSYAPHLGTVNTIAVFLDTCVKGFMQMLPMTILLVSHMLTPREMLWLL